MAEADLDESPVIQLNPQKWNLRLSTNIWAYSTTVMFVFFTITGFLVDENLEDRWYYIVYNFICGGILLAWSLACYAEAYAINELRKKRKQNGIQSNGDKLLIAFWFISALIILIPAILIAIVFIEMLGSYIW